MFKVVFFYQKNTRIWDLDCTAPERNVLYNINCTAKKTRYCILGTVKVEYSQNPNKNIVAF